VEDLKKYIVEWLKKSFKIGGLLERTWKKMGFL